MMLPNCVQIWEVMLAAMKLGACVIPATTLLTPEDLRDRIARGKVRHVITDPAGAEKIHGIAGDFGRHVVGEHVPGWLPFDDAYDESSFFMPHGETLTTDPMLLYFTSGTTAKPKLVVHTHRSYPVGHLSTMYWLGLREGDVHMNISSPGWAKHAWSNFFAPFNAGATVFVYNYARFSAKSALEVARAPGHHDDVRAADGVAHAHPRGPDAREGERARGALSAGEPLNPEVIETVRQAWGVTIRDGYGQTETTAQVGNSPGQRLKPGSMGRPLPGYRIVAARRGGRSGGGGGGDLHRARRRAARRAHGRLRGRPEPERVRDAPRPLPHRRRRGARRRRLHHLRRARRRRLQELRLPHPPVRARERPHRARRGGRGRGGAEPRSGARAPSPRPSSS